MTTDRLSTATPEQRFNDLFTRHYHQVFAFAARRIHVDDAADTAAEVFTTAWRRLRRVPDGPEALPWLYAVARNVVSNTRRSYQRRNRLLSRAASASSERESHTESVTIVTAFASLDPREQEILRLAAWEGLQPGEISLVLGCTPNAAAVRLFRARRATGVRHG